MKAYSFLHSLTTQMKRINHFLQSESSINGWGGGAVGIRLWILIELLDSKILCKTVEFYGIF